MDIGKIKLLLNTVKYLKPVQIYYRLYYFFRNRIISVKARKKSAPVIKSIKWKNKLFSYSSYFHTTKSFTFLNISHKFLNQIDWNYSKYGKLWTYNLNYFDFLNQKSFSKEIGLLLIQDFINNDHFLKDGKEPYPISLRGINWVKFLSNNQVNDEIINNILYFHYHILFKNLEYHLLGNHILENAFSLLFGSYYFQDEKLYDKSKKLLVSELNIQILNDGGHFELSPMYHQIILVRLLDCIQLIKLNNTWKKNDLLFFLISKARKMCSWLQNITYQNGNIPMVNDATFNIAPNSDQIFSYAKDLGIPVNKISLSDSGYRKIPCGIYELFIDIGNIASNYQPGHSHSDIFNFELNINGSPIFVDTGISTYEKNNIRQNERATSSHNTVKIGSKDQNQVWGGFRMAKRAKIIQLVEKPNFIEASHNGYISDGYIHTRSFLWGNRDLLLTDKINKSTGNSAKAFFHLHYLVKKPFVDGDKVILESSEVSVKLEGFSNICIDEYQLPVGFNKTKLSYKIVILFDQILKTQISI